jgi:hypothetical protein
MKDDSHLVDVVVVALMMMMVVVVVVVAVVMGRGHFVAPLVLLQPKNES